MNNNNNNNTANEVASLVAKVASLVAKVPSQLLCPYIITYIGKNMFDENKVVCNNNIQNVFNKIFVSTSTSTSTLGRNNGYLLDHNIIHFSEFGDTLNEFLPTTLIDLIASYTFVPIVHSVYSNIYKQSLMYRYKILPLSSDFPITMNCVNCKDSCDKNKNTSNFHRLICEKCNCCQVCNDITPSKLTFTFLCRICYCTSDKQYCMKCHNNNNMYVHNFLKIYYCKNKCNNATTRKFLLKTTKHTSDVHAEITWYW